MAQIINPAIMEELRALAEPLAQAALAHAPEMTANDPAAVVGDDAVASAENVTAITAATSALLQCFPVTEIGVVVALATIAGTVLGQCDGDRSKLWEAFKYQTSQTLADIEACISDDEVS